MAESSALGNRSAVYSQIGDVGRAEADLTAAEAVLAANQVDPGSPAWRFLVSVRRDLDAARAGRAHMAQPTSKTSM